MANQGFLLALLVACTCIGGAVATGIEFRQVSTASKQTCAAATNGTAYCWGYDQYGELGLGNFANVTWDRTIEPSSMSPPHRRRVSTYVMHEPKRVVGDGFHWKDIQTNADFTCATNESLKVFCWGQCSKSSRPCGGGTHRANGDMVQDRRQPDASLAGNLGCGKLLVGQEWDERTNASCADSWQSLSLSGSSDSVHGCGVTASGEAKCWGQGNYNTMGDGEARDNPLPMAVSGQDTWTKISASKNAACGITSAGTAMCWGLTNSYGRLGNDGTGEGPSPIAVAGSDSWQDICVDDDHGCGITTAGEAKCWGRGRYGAVGNGAEMGFTAPDFATPQTVSGGHQWLQISCGGQYTCGVTSNHVGMCWGYNNAGTLGQSSGSDSNVPLALPGGYQWRQISAAVGHACGVTQDDALLCWGKNFYGSLGIGDATDNTIFEPTVVSGSKSPATTTTTTTTTTTIAAGTSTTLVSTTLTLELGAAAVNAILGNATVRAAFDDAFATDIGLKLGIDNSRIAVTGVAPGSLVVEFTVQSASTEAVVITESAFSEAMVGDIALATLSSDPTLVSAGVVVPSTVAASSFAAPEERVNTPEGTVSGGFAANSGAALAALAFACVLQA